MTLYVCTTCRDADHEAGVHNSAYDFHDKLLPIGVVYWCAVVRTALGSGAAASAE